MSDITPTKGADRNLFAIASWIGFVVATQGQSAMSTHLVAAFLYLNRAGLLKADAT